MGLKLTLELRSLCATGPGVPIQDAASANVFQVDKELCPGCQKWHHKFLLSFPCLFYPILFLVIVVLKLYGLICMFDFYWYHYLFVGLIIILSCYSDNFIYFIPDLGPSCLRFCFSLFIYNCCHFSTKISFIIIRNYWKQQRKHTHTYICVTFCNMGRWHFEKYRTFHSVLRASLL